MYEFLKNLIIAVFKKDDMKEARKELNRWRPIIQAEGITGMKRFMAQFKYRKEDRDWTPDKPEMVVMAGWRDDCDGAAVLGKWAFKQMGMDSDFYRLKGKTSHRICVTTCQRFFTTNGTVVEVPEYAKWPLNYILTWGWHRDMGYQSIRKI